MPLFLGSYAAALFAIIPILLIALRIVFEERFLRGVLEGYDDYIGKVRWRMVPLVW